MARQRSDPNTKIRRDLCKALDEIKTSGSFAAFSRIAHTSIRPIAVRDVGEIPHPLKEATARQLIDKARQAPYGKGSETFVDTSVRNTWELDAAQLDLSPHWASTVKVACKWVGQQLGITAPVTAELYKMLIYEKGALFKPHTDTEKIPGMFGTLVICLPSEHQGGDLVVKHRDVTKVFKTSEKQPSMACWFSDVTHEVLPVTSGFRWVLTYNLAIPQQQAVGRPSAAMQTPELDSLRTALRAWLESQGPNDHDHEPGFLYYLLDHTYTEANLSLHSLKGADQTRMQCLKDICQDQNVTLLLGVIEKEQTGGCEEIWDDNDPYGEWGYDDEDSDADDSDDSDDGNVDDDWHSFVDIIDTDISIKRLVTTDGSTLREGMTLVDGELEENLLQDHDDPFHKAERGEQDYSGFTGNEGVSATHWYRMTVAVIIPNDALDHFLVKGSSSKDAQNLLPRYLAKCSEPATRASAMKLVRYLAHMAWSDSLNGRSFFSYSYSGSPDPFVFDEEIALQYVATVLEHREYKLFCEAMEWFKTKLGAPLYTLVKEAAAKDSFDFTQIQSKLARTLCSHSVAHQMQLLIALGLPSDPSHNPQIVKWAADKIVPAAIEACRGPTVECASGSAIVNMVSAYHDIEYLKTRLIPVIENQVALTPFALSAVLSMIRLATEGVLDRAATLELCKPLVASVLNNVNVASLRTREAADAEYNSSKPSRIWDHVQRVIQSRRHPHPEMYINPSLLTECFTRCAQVGWEDLARRFCLKIVADIGQVPSDEFHFLWIPFVRELISALDAAKIPLSTPRYQEAARAILETYLEKRVGMEPSGASDFSGQGPVSCNCNDCVVLNAFLASGQRTWEFMASEKRRRHVQTMVVYLKHSCSCNIGATPRGRSHTLIVSKSVDTGAEAKRDWDNRYAQAWDQFTKFDQDKLKVLLGEQDYEKITSMRHLRFNKTGSANSERRLPGRPASGGDVVAGKKRGAHD
ncbi:hypothetical protein QBC42DRAFT_237836 [Cladorrhinum samala]|uniref:Prolyl 4-hydroxylase alpha subunit Fe(2+) 2OG dioxygenase domain-containing protein n=1 Tax=Cladorrhinum samala TaxID=585594 RepID=A0AAV9HB42_9PEZI|nr:hypothetical protein QBC42DRAFT_237836 [Cladorrhinum samala]